MIRIQCFQQWFSPQNKINQKMACYIHLNYMALNPEVSQKVYITVYVLETS